MKIFNQVTIHFENATYRVLHKKKQCLCFFRGARKMFKKLLLHKHFGQAVTNTNWKGRIRTLYILKMLYRGCSTEEAFSLLLPQSTKSFKNKWVLQMEYGKALTNQNQETRIRRLYALKMLSTRFYSKEAISLLLSRSTWNFKIKWFVHKH